jgi:hypothetical protein
LAFSYTTLKMMKLVISYGSLVSIHSSCNVLLLWAAVIFAKSAAACAAVDATMYA